MQEYLEPTSFLDFDHPTVQGFSEGFLMDVDRSDDVAVAKALFEAVRDHIWYDPFELSLSPDDFAASQVLEAGAGWCVPKAVVLTALARLNGIPARLGFADVKNHLTSPKLMELMQTDVFAWHGYSELYLNGKWVKLSTAFNIDLCKRFGVKVLEFDAEEGALMHPYDTSGRKHMEYVREHGSFEDLPLEQIFETFVEIYPYFFKDANGAYYTTIDERNDGAFGR